MKKYNNRLVFGVVIGLLTSALLFLLGAQYSMADENISVSDNNKLDSTITRFSCPAKWPRGDHPEWVLRYQSAWGNSEFDFNSSDFYKGIDSYYQQTFLLSCSYGEKRYTLEELFAKGFSHTLILKPSGLTQKCDVDTDMQDEAAVKNCDVKLNKGQVFKPTIYIPEEINENTKLLGFHLNQSSREITNIAKINGFSCANKAQDMIISNKLVNGKFVKTLKSEDGLDCQKDKDHIQIYFHDDKSYKIIQIAYPDSDKNKDRPYADFDDEMTFRFGFLIDWDRKNGNPIRLKSIRAPGGNFVSSAVMLWDSRIEKDPPTPDLE